MDWIKLHRSIMGWEWYKDENTARVFIHCLLKAEWRHDKYKGIDIPKGSFKTTLPEMAAELGMSISQIRTAINHLKLTGELTVSLTGKFRVVNVRKYCVYQEGENKIDSQIDRQLDSQLTGWRQDDDRQTDFLPICIKKERSKEVKEDKEKTYTSPLEKSIADFIEYRKKAKRAMTDRAVELMRKELDKLASDDETKIKILEQSILNGWIGVFALKNQPGAQAQSPYRIVTGVPDFADD